MAHVHPAASGSLLLDACTVQPHGAAASGSLMLSAQMSPCSTEKPEHEGTSKHLAAHSVRLTPWHVMRLVCAPLALLHQPACIKNSGIGAAGAAASAAAKDGRAKGLHGCNERGSTISRMLKILLTLKTSVSAQTFGSR